MSNSSFNHGKKDQPSVRKKASAGGKEKNTLKKEAPKGKANTLTTGAPAKKETKAELLKKKKERLIKIGIIVACSLAALIIIGVIAYHAILDHYLDKLNVVTKETGLVYQTEIITGEEGSAVTDEPDHNGELDANNLPLICDTKNVLNVLLLATDSRKNEAGRSDSMIMVSINSKTGKIILCSFMRDILAAYPKEPTSPVAGKYDKLTHAHAYGGPELTMAVLKETFNIDVDYYAKVNFTAFRDIVDAMGGLDMYLTSSEVNAINNILTLDDPANDVLGITSKDLISPVKEGVHHLTGVQALSHARNRSVGSDWARTQRQRDLIQAMAKKATTLSLSQLNDLLNTVLPLITTNIQKDMIKSLIGNVPSYLTYEIKSTRIPGDGMYTEQNYSIIPDLEANCTALYELIYDEKAPVGTSSGRLPVKTTAKNPTTTTTSPTTTTVPPTTTTAPPVTTTTPPVTTTKVPVTSSEPEETETKEPETGEKDPEETETKEPEGNQPPTSTAVPTSTTVSGTDEGNT